MVETTGQGEWCLYSRLLLRRAGFNIGLLTDLADQRVEGAAAEYRAQVSRFEEQRSQALAGLQDEVAAAAEAHDRARLRQLSKTRSRIGRRRPLDAALASCWEAASAYHSAWQTEDNAWGDLQASLADERAGRAMRVRRALSDDRLQDAVLQLAPSFAAEVERWSASAHWQHSNAKNRAFFRRVYLYCQRLGAKNETTSFFGPLIHGTITPDSDGIEFNAETPSGVVDTEAFVAFWAVCTLARTMADDARLAGRLPVSWIPACRREGETVTLSDGRRVAVSATQCQVINLIDGAHSALDIAREAGLDFETVAGVLAQLQRAGFVRCWPEPPSTTPRPLDWLITYADRHGADTDWPGKLRALRHRAAHYAEAAGPAKRHAALQTVESCFNELTGADARRAAGQMYADRLVVSLDAKGDQGPVTIGTAVAAHWARQLGPVLDVAAHYGELLQSACADLCTDILREAGVTEMPYDELIRRSQAAVEQGLLAEHTTRADQFAADVTRIVADACWTPDGAPPRAVLSPADLAPLRPSANRARFVSPDLMLEKLPGQRERIVLGELHPYVFAWGSQGLFDNDPEQTRAAFDDHLEPWGGEERLATVIRRRRHKGLVAEWFPGRFIEITAVATEERHRAVPVTDLVVELVNGRARLRGPDGEIVLYAGEDDHVHLRAFAAPTVVLPQVRLGDVMPRWGVGDLIAQRARWWIDPSELRITDRQSHDETFRAIQRLRVHHGLPRFVFAHIEGEPKPVGIDLDNPLAVDALATLAATAGTGQIALTEMRPAPGRLWLRWRDRPVTSEFRLALRWEAR